MVPPCHWTVMRPRLNFVFTNTKGPRDPGQGQHSTTASRIYFTPILVWLNNLHLLCHQVTVRDIFHNLGMWLVWMGMQTWSGLWRQKMQPRFHHFVGQGSHASWKVLDLKKNFLESSGNFRKNPGTPRLQNMESPGFFLKFQGPGKWVWSWKVLEFSSGST